ncbi:kinesin light chain [Delitschia confertaspora ATCC 74209]|uniref:Kinesin light chain n=1 Tax=Delitschia confertaspora ATCC 74209 TaxID=1513339 RepID=A0A9P4MT49_9PLEO|nr:kinesin light chain [Delitschia confertaspora ATCC 74209]
MDSPGQLNCADYHVAWICSLSNVELAPVILMLDERYSTPPYNTHYDENTYVCGAIADHTVVIATCPHGETANVNAAWLTGSIFKTFPNIGMAVLVGIGGGIPQPEVSEDALDDIHLGDVVIGWAGNGKPASVYRDRGRSKVDGQFEIIGTMQNPDWRLINALSVLTIDVELGIITFHDQLQRLQKNKKFAHPGLKHDLLFRARYRHTGDYGSDCTSCNQSELVQRLQRSKDDKHKLVFHQGRIATGNSVIQDGELRDEIRKRCKGALCVEMEAAGVDVNRKCLVIRGTSDYADSHKNDVPLSFVGRKTQLDDLGAYISSEGCQRLAIYGLGGCGKTALALESAYRTRERQPARTVFWAYLEIGTLLRIPGIADDNADVKRLVKAWLSDEGFGLWLIVIDNADDISVLLDLLETESSGCCLIDFLPHSRKGSVVFTTRTRKVAIDLASRAIMPLGELAGEEAEEVLKTRLLPDNHYLLNDNQVVHVFLDMLAFLALAVVQAVAFINKNNSTLAEYISIYRDSKEDAIELLSKDFEDHGRYRDMKNPVVTTWYISFKQIRKQNPLAADYLSFMACTTGEKIPESLLLPGHSTQAVIGAVGMLDAYAFITERRERQRGRETQHQERTFDMHRLVNLAMHNWLKEHQQWDGWVNRTLARLVEIVPYGSYKRREIWTAYLPHAMDIVELPEACNSEDSVLLLDRIGRCEQTLGRYEAAEATHRKVLKQREKLLGKKNPHTLTSMNEVALALSYQGRYAEADKMYQETLALEEKMLGEEHSDTLTSMNNMEFVLNNQGKYTEAEEMHQKTLALREKVLGKEHPETLISMNGVALALGNQGKYTEAEKMYQEMLALREKVFGKDHRKTFNSIYN